MWEDPENAQGGKWVIQSSKGKNTKLADSGMTELDQMWLYTVCGVLLL